MFEFRGIDLNTKYIKPSTWRWLNDMAGDIYAPFEGHRYDEGQGILLWTYSFDEDDEEVPEELAIIVREAMSREWRFIVLDADGADCELFKSYEEMW